MSSGETSLPRMITGERVYKPAGSALARWLMGLFGWRVLFDGVPTLQGVVMVYPHTSNWDFVVGIFAKWALGLQVKFWAKDSLFRVPVMGPWVRWIGGVAVDRSSKNGMVGDTAQQMEAARAKGEFFWLAVAPEGTRSLTTGWRSGAYQVALQAKAPIGLAWLDYDSRTVGFCNFIEPSGDAAADFALMAQILQGRRGKRAELASPIRLRT